MARNTIDKLQKLKKKASAADKAVIASKNSKIVVSKQPKSQQTKAAGKRKAKDDEYESEEQEEETEVSEEENSSEDELKNKIEEIKKREQNVKQKEGRN